MLVIGLTGGVGSGKTTVAEGFKQLGVPVIDADDITRGLTRPNSPALDEITAAFGEAILTPANELDRRALRTIIFTDDAARQQLEAILHPRVRCEIQRKLRELSSSYALVVIPLMIESGMTDLFARILVVDCSEAQQTARVAARDDCTAQEVRAIMDRQVTRESRLAIADDIIDNAGGVAELTRRIGALHEQYLALAAT